MDTKRQLQVRAVHALNALGLYESLTVRFAAVTAVTALALWAVKPEVFFTYDGKAMKWTGKDGVLVAWDKFAVLVGASSLFWF